VISRSQRYCYFPLVKSSKERFYIFEINQKNTNDVIRHNIDRLSKTIWPSVHIDYNRFIYLIENLDNYLKR